MVDLLLKKKKISRKTIIISQFFIHTTIVGLFLNIRKLISFINLLTILETNDLNKGKVDIITLPSCLIDMFYMYLNSLISRFIQFSRWKFVKKILKKSTILTTKRRRKFILKNNLSKFCFNLLNVNLSISFVINSLNPIYFIYLIIKYKYSLLVIQKSIIKQLFLILNLNDLLFSAFAISYFQLYLFTASSIIENIIMDYINYISAWQQVFAQLFYNKFTVEEKKKRRLDFLLAYKYIEYLKKFNIDLHTNKLHFIKKNYTRDVFLSKLKFIKRPLKIVRNSIYQRKFYKFISISFFKKYLDILYLWFFNNSYNSTSQIIHRNTFILYLKHLNISFFYKYLLFINKSKRIVITLNVNIVKNNLFYTLINNSGSTIATLSTGLYYALPRNRNVKRNPFKKSIAYLTTEMFSLMFYNKFLFPLQYYNWDRQLEFFKGSEPKNGDLEWKKKKKKTLF